MATLFELSVALMLIGLGVRAILVAARQGPVRSSARASSRPRGARASRRRRPTSTSARGRCARRPLLVGAVHGLAGSGALTALVLTTLPTPAAQLIYMVVFGLGSTLGMAALSGVLGWPLARVGRNRALARGVSATVGCVSIVARRRVGFERCSRESTVESESQGSRVSELLTLDSGLSTVDYSYSTVTAHLTGTFSGGSRRGRRTPAGARSRRR